MRLALALSLVALAAAPASAQSRFVEACTASPDLEAAEGIDGPALCECAAEGAIARGVLPADLDRSVEALADPEAAAHLEAVSTLVREATVACGVQQLYGDAAYETDEAGQPVLQRAYAESFDPSVPAVLQTGPARLGEPVEVGAAGAPVPAATVGAPAVGAPASVAPGGVRVGYGRAPVRTEQSGAGAAIRIVG